VLLANANQVVRRCRTQDIPHPHFHEGFVACLRVTIPRGNQHYSGTLSICALLLISSFSWLLQNNKTLDSA